MNRTLEIPIPLCIAMGMERERERERFQDLVKVMVALSNIV
jgi:hypothetical protein